MYLIACNVEFEEKNQGGGELEEIGKRRKSVFGLNLFSSNSTSKKRLHKH